MNPTICVECKSENVHYIEFLLDGNMAPRKIQAVNPNTEEIDEQNLPKYLDGYYCHNCQSFCSTI